MLKNISMRHLIPLLLMSGALVFVVFFYTVSLPAAREQALKHSLQQTRELLQAQQGRLTDILATNIGRQLNKEVYYSSTDPSTYRLLILDENNIVIRSNRSRIHGKNILETNLPIQAAVLDQISEENGIVLIPPTAKGRYISGYAPLRFKRGDQDFRWKLVIIRDYRRTADTIIAIATYPSELLATFLLTVSILAIMVLRSHLEARIYPLLNAATRISHGEKNVRTGMTGADEFSEIAASLDQMAGHVDAHRAELEAAKENAEKANAAKNHFLHHMSHEIQTPLTALMGFLDLMKETKVDSDASLYLRTMETSARTLSNLVNDLLETNRLEAGTVTLNPNPFCLNTIVQDLLDSLLPKVREKGLSLKISCVDDEPIWIDSDAHIFRQILVNFIGNAIQYTEEGNITLIIDTLPLENGNIELSLTVKDTGIGIKEQEIQHIFERFYRSDHPAVRRQKGAGIGLAVCRDFTKLIGGTIEVESELGVGSTFSFSVTVPKASPEVDFDFTDLSIREQENLNILVVEYAPVTQLLFKSLLEKSGHHVETCINAKTAIQNMKDRLIYPHLEPVSMILMDLHLPVIDGFQAAAEIRGLDSRYKRIPIIATSTQDDQSTRDRCLSGIFDGFIAKPINRQYLTEEIFRLSRLMDTTPSDEITEVEVTPVA